MWTWPLDSLTAEERVEFEAVHTGPGLPKVGSRMMTRVLSGQDLVDGWVVLQDGVYRYAVMQEDYFTVRSVMVEYLAAEVHWNS